jgi:hypothetical protein
MADERPLYPAPRQDPVTGEPLVITRLEGPSTGIAIEGRFTFGTGSRLDQLSPEHLAFVEVFLKNRGIIKDVEAELGISYPTVRARLDEVIRAMGYAPYADANATPPAEGEPLSPEAERRALLADVAAGRIPAREAAFYLRVGGKKGEGDVELRIGRHGMRIDRDAPGKEKS